MGSVVISSEGLKENFSLYHSKCSFLLVAIEKVMIGLDKKSATVLNSSLICLTLNLNRERDSDHLTIKD